MRVLIAAILSVLLVDPAPAVFFTYAEWARLSEYGRSNYIAGLFDGMVSFSEPEDSWIGMHYYHCISNAKITNGQLANNVLVYASSRPNLQNKPVATALVNYLKEACGPPQPPSPAEGRPRPPG